MWPLEIFKLYAWPSFLLNSTLGDRLVLDSHFYLFPYPLVIKVVLVGDPVVDLPLKVWKSEIQRTQ